MLQPSEVMMSADSSAGTLLVELASALAGCCAGSGLSAGKDAAELELGKVTQVLSWVAVSVWFCDR